MGVVKINGYKITKRGKKAIYVIEFLIVFFILNLGFKLHVNGKADPQRIMLLNKNDNVVIKPKTDSSVESKSSEPESKVLTSEEHNVVSEIKAEVTVNKQELSYPVESAYVKDGKKIAFLTFDDGPSKDTTLKILDILRSYNIKATFFIIGSAAEKNRDILKTIVNDGHAIGNHTYSHEYDTIYSNVTTFINEIKKTDNIFKDILGSGFTTRLVRFPGGDYQTPSMKPFVKELNNQGYVDIDWNAINGDGEGNDIPADKLVKRLKDTALNQSHLVILMHDSSTKQTTVEALPQIIEYLKAEAYEFALLR